MEVSCVKACKNGCCFGTPRFSPFFSVHVKKMKTYPLEEGDEKFEMVLRDVWQIGNGWLN